MRRSPTLFGLILLLACSAPALASPDRDARMEWWREARFGMFIHWGLYALPARHEAFGPGVETGHLGGR